MRKILHKKRKKKTSLELEITEEGIVFRFTNNRRNKIGSYDLEKPWKQEPASVNIPVSPIFGELSLFAVVYARVKDIVPASHNFQNSYLSRCLPCF
jgi:hypothetical protein